MIRKLLVSGGRGRRRPQHSPGVAAAGRGPDGEDRQADPDHASNTALLNGIVNPNGASTTYYFQFGLTNGYGSNTAPRAGGAGVQRVRRPARPRPGSSREPTYHYRLVATNEFGTTVGADRIVQDDRPHAPGSHHRSRGQAQHDERDAARRRLPAGSRDQLVLPVGHEHGLRAEHHGAEARRERHRAGRRLHAAGPPRPGRHLPLPPRGAATADRAVATGPTRAS